MSIARRVIAALLVALSFIGAAAWTASAAIPKGSSAEVIFETGTKGPIGDPGYAVVKGWWGREGGHHTGTTYFSLNAANSQGIVTTDSVAALHKALGDGGSFSSLRVAFVLASKDGSTERPVVHAGETAGEAFKWWSDTGVGSGIGGGKGAYNGSFVSTQRQWDKFWHAGRPVQAFDSKLVLHDVADNSVSAAPEGTSILNTWPAGTKVSVVLYVSDGYNNELEPKVKVGPDGRAMSAWLTLETIAKPGNPVQSSAGYRVLTASPGEGSKLVNGLPPASASFHPVPSGGSTSSASASASPSGGAATAAGPGSSSSGGGSSGGSSGTGWIWIVVAVVVVAGAGTAFVVWRRTSPGGTT
jgi:hypothetical protein